MILSSKSYKFTSKERDSESGRVAAPTLGWPIVCVFVSCKRWVTPLSSFSPRHPLLSLTQNGRHHARTTPAMEHGQNHLRILIRRIDEKISHHLKTNRLRCQLGSPVARLRERDECANGSPDFLQNTVGRGGIVSGDIFPNLGEVHERARMEYKFAHARRRSWLIWRRRAKPSSPSMGTTRPLLMSS